jgi:GNAT superfamily N-acetyltransferase
MDYIIKEIEKKDIYDYIYVNTYAWNETYKGIMADEFLDKIKNELDKNVERLEKRFDTSKIEEPDYKRFLLYVNNEPVGIVAVCKSREEKYPNSGELCSLYLLNKIKKKGYGKILFEKAKQELKDMGYNDMIIYCLKDNPTTSFYEQMGGKLVLEKERFIGGKDLIENCYYYHNI